MSYAFEIAKKVFEHSPGITNTTETVDMGYKKVIRNVGEPVILRAAYMFIAEESLTKANNLIGGFGDFEDFPSDVVSAYRKMQKEMVEKWEEA